MPGNISDLSQFLAQKITAKQMGKVQSHQHFKRMQSKSKGIISQLQI